MKILGVLSLTFLLFLVAHTAHTAWYFDVITEGQIQNAYFAGWNGSDCSQIRANASKTVRVPQESDRYGEFIEQTCIKGRNDNREFKGNKEMAKKEIQNIEKMLVERMAMLKTR